MYCLAEKRFVYGGLANVRWSLAIPLLILGVIRKDGTANLRFVVILSEEKVWTTRR